MPELARDAAGFPVLLSDAKPAPQTEAAPQPGVAELARRRDAVREAARELDPLKPQDVKERLRGVTSRQLTDGEIEAFTKDVRVQRVDDLVDALDQRHRGSNRGRRTVRIQVPRGHVKRAVNALDDGELGDVTQRLRARGWSEEDVKSGLGGHLTQARVAKHDPMR